MAESKHDDYSPRHQSRAVIWAALIGSIGAIVAALIGVSFGRGRGEDQRADLRRELEQRDAEVAELRKEIAGVRSAQEASGQGGTSRWGPKTEPQSDQGDLAGQALAEIRSALPSNSSGNVGTYNYQAKVAQLRVWGHGSREGDQLQLVLESLSNQPSQGLTLSFLVENSEKNEYDLRLSSPEDTAVVIDDLHGEHKLINTEGIKDNPPLRLPAFSRHRFKLMFEPVAAGPRSINFQAVFVAKVYSTLGGEGKNRVTVNNISMARFK
ncbi:MAG: hypothetical protein QOH06_2881 [Acidobacteriota bacterium]|jgi:hypothetical protein|nr:hypothetical protein [Acidobacteriota bacterium]